MPCRSVMRMFNWKREGHGSPFFFFFLPKLLTYLEVSSNRKKMHNQLQDLGSRPCVPDEKFLMYLPT